jgi:hypothetical protein
MSGQCKPVLIVTEQLCTPEHAALTAAVQGVTRV